MCVYVCVCVRVCARVWVVMDTGTLYRTEPLVQRTGTAKQHRFLCEPNQRSIEDGQIARWHDGNNKQLDSHSVLCLYPVH